MKEYKELLANREFRNLILYGFIARVPHSAIGVVLTLHVTQTLGENFTSAGLVATVFMVGMAISGPWRGRVLDKNGLRYTLVPSIIIEAIVWPLISISPYVVLLPLIFIAGLFVLPIFTIMRKSISIIVPEDQRKLAFSIDSISLELIWMAAPALGIVLCTKISTPFTLVAFGLSSSLAGIGLWLLNPPTESDELGVSGKSKGKQTFKQRISWVPKPLWAIFLASFSSGFMLVGLDLSFIALLEHMGKIDDVWLVYFFWCASSAIGAIVYSAFKVEASPILLTLTMCVLGILCVFGTTPLMAALLAIPTGLLCAASITAVTEATSKAVQESRRGEAMGWQGSFMTIGSSMAAPLIGLSIDGFGAWSGFAAAALVGVVICLVALPLYGGRKRSAALS